MLQDCYPTHVICMRPLSNYTYLLLSVTDNQAVYQVKLMFLGNNGFLPLLSLALTFSLLDDDHISYWLGHGKKKSAKSMTSLLFLCNLQLSHLTM